MRDAIDADVWSEFDGLFPEHLSSEGRPWGVQSAEAAVLISQMGGWLGGIIESAIIEQRIGAEAEANAKQTGFN